MTIQHQSSHTTSRTGRLVRAGLVLAMLLTTPAHVVAFVVLQMPVLDVAAWMLMALSFAICAVVIVKTPDDEWDLPPRVRA